MHPSGRFAVLDLETRCHLPLARAVLGLSADIPDAEVRLKLVERRRAQSHGGSDFQKLPFHEPVAAAVLLAERVGEDDETRVIATEWRCWTAGDVPLSSFLERFFETVAGRTWVGFNSVNFDLPLVELWASKLLVRAPAHFQARRAEGPRCRDGAEHHCDLVRELVNFAPGAGTLDELCKFHGLPGKPGVGGEDVERLVAEGRIDEVHAYNVTDVLQTHLLFLHSLVRAGELTREGARLSAESALKLTRERIAAHLPQGTARTLLEKSLGECAASPLVSSPVGGRPT